MTIRTTVRSRATIKAVVVAIALLATVHADASPACGPSVILSGDPAVTVPIADALHVRGIATRDDCPAETAHLELHEQMIVISIVDSEGRAAERRVADVATATVLIASFAADTDLPGPRAGAEPRPVVAAGDLQQPQILMTAAKIQPLPAVRGIVGLAAESSIANDGSLWAGVRAHACVDLGPVCVGGQARYGTDVLLSGEAERAEATRSGGDLQLTADYPLTKDGWSVTPGVGVGVGWLHVRRDYMDAAGNDTVEMDAGGLRTGAHVVAAFPIGRTFTATLGAAVDVSPYAHTRPFVEETRQVPGEPWLYGSVQIGLELHR